nr:YeeE/YedE family protein [uncultured Catonella sp.]
MLVDCTYALFGKNYTKLVALDVTAARREICKKMKQKERIAGFILLAAVVLFGMFGLKTPMLYFRLAAGLALGYALSRGYMGFAGSVNRAYNAGSTKLMRALMFMFFITAILSTAFLFGADLSELKLGVRPINMGLVIGGILFGFGMAFCSCCASGALTDMAAELPKAFITLVFLCVGVFLGFPIQHTATWVKDSIIKTGDKNGVFFPDLFKFDGFDGYLGSIIITGILCLIVVKLSYMYENKRKKDGSYSKLGSEMTQLSDEKKSLEENGGTCPLCESGYEKIFVRSWSLKKASIVIAGIFILLMGITKSGWGVSTPFGIWFGKVLMLFGVSADAIGEFVKGDTKHYVAPLLEHGSSVQDIGIILGAFFYMLTSNTFVASFKASLKINFKQIIFYAIGGFVMGFGTRLSNGCNAGALFTPIANFSLSGWFYLIFMASGGVLGNIVAKKVRI